MLRACAARGEEETGKKAAERAMEAEPWGAGAHVAMANLYSSKGQWCEAARKAYDEAERGCERSRVVINHSWGGEEDRAVGMARYVPDQTNLESEVVMMVIS